MKTPDVLYPTLVRGIIRGPIRCESLDGSEIFLPEREGILRIEPFKMDGKVFAVCHQQKKATYFSLLYEPFIYHWGKFWHLQEKNSNGQWIAGSEKGLYIRTPGWRWDIDPHLEKPWVFSKGFVGGHLD